MTNHYLQILLAANAPKAVIFRRGPSAWYHLILWHLDNDRFEHGAWLRGRIYEDRCDLSPDGSLLLCFVHQGRKLTTSYSDSWTALSRPPWLQALALWPQGTTYGGGGSFVSAKGAKVELNLSGVWPPHPDHQPIDTIKVNYGISSTPSAQLIGPRSNWCGVDQNGRKILIRGRSIFEIHQGNERLIADFSAGSPDPQAAPAWASEFPKMG